MKKLFYFIIPAVLLICGCGKMGSVSDPKGTIEANIRNDPGGVRIELEDYEIALMMDQSNNFIPTHLVRATGFYPDFKIASVGKVSGLGAITKIPESGWSDAAAVKPGYGYVLKTGGTDGGRPIRVEYARVYVKEWMTTTGDLIIGCKVAYQAPFIP